MRNKIKILIIIGLLMIAILFGFFGYVEYQRKEEYNNAIQLYNTYKYDMARDIFKSLKNYEDSKAYYEEITKYIEDYDKALSLYKSNAYDSAKDIFLSLGKYKDSSAYYEKTLLHIENYNKALGLYDNGEYEEAKALFTELKKYKDSETYVSKIELITFCPQIFSIEEFADKLDNNINECFLKAREEAYSPMVYFKLESACNYAELLLDTQNILIEKLSSYSSSGILLTYLKQTQKYVEAQKVLNETNVENVRYIFLEKGTYTSEENENIVNIRNINRDVVDNWQSRRDEERLKMFTDVGFNTEEAKSIISQRLDVFSFIDLNITKSE